MNLSIEVIRARYEQELRRNRVAVTGDELPLSYESMTDEWLTAVLCREVAGAKVIDHRSSAADTGSTNRRRLFLRYNEVGAAAALPVALFCKASHDLANRIVLGVSGGARCEVLFYSNVRPLLEIEAPVAYYAKLDEETVNSMIMLCDLTHEVQSFCDHNTVMTRPRAESQLRLLSRLHGRCYGDPALRERIRQFPTFGQFFGNTLQFGMREGSEEGFRQGEAVIPARLYKRSGNIWPATVTAIDDLERGPLTLAHGDVHLKNWYVANDGEMGLGDWQCTARAHWARDFAYTIATALAVEDRRRWERELLTFYLDALAAQGGPWVEFDDAWMSYRRHLVTALTWWTVTLCPTPDLPDMQPKAVSLEFIKRIATAMDDLDSLDT